MNIFFFARYKEFYDYKIHLGVFVFGVIGAFIFVYFLIIYSFI